MTACARCGRAAKDRYLVEMADAKSGKAVAYPSYICKGCAKTGIFETEDLTFYVGRKIVREPGACKECGQPMPDPGTGFRGQAK